MPKRTCSIEGCERAHAARGLCGLHWEAWRRTADPADVRLITRRPKPIRLCSIEGCENKHEAKGFCQNHYVLWKRNGTPERLPRPVSTCSVEGCDKPRRGRGYCDMHFWRVRKYADPHRTELIYGDDVRRFMAKVDKSGPGGCWLWEGSVFDHGYGRFTLGASGHALAHRYSYELHVGPIPPGLQVDHLCFVPRCVNPDHLEPVTGVENRRRRRPWTKKKKVT